MAYEKKLCILKQIGKGFTADGMPLMGAVYAERLGNELTITPRIAGLAPLKEGRYALAVLVGDREYCLELRGNTALRVPAGPSLEGGFAVLLCFIRHEAEPVAFGSSGSAPDDYRQLLGIFRTRAPGRPLSRAEIFREAESPREDKTAPKTADEGERIPAVPLPPTGVPGVPGPNVPFAPGVPLPGSEPPAEQPKDAHDAGSPPQTYDDEALTDKNYYAAPEGAEDEPAARESAPNAAPPPGHTYFDEVRPRLEEAFRKGERDDRLSRAIPHSEWTQWEDALIGIVYRYGQPHFLCLAVEAQGEPPAELKERAVFVPATPYTDDEGFYVVFQDAATGEFVK